MSAQSFPVLTLTLKATAAIVGNRFVQLDGTQAGAGENALGVARQAGAIGDVVTVDVLGTAIVEAGAAVAVGDTVKSNTDGTAITWATSGVKLGAALDAAGAAGQLIEILLIPNVA